ncbi:HD domain-containing protein [Picosynechococcus sp. PCC 73109]|uniref:HD domain-containing protein n=1 Tax=Picosynechococcus sp. PCC 73109 TaxID=374982 RepID=UPI00074591A1|nr:HD domain-containing protein [Picosynechococcus sp. PCC 73109]AMA09553.1 phosphohydrolase [Picosynechococcus sp. PCC 73109]
MKLSDRFSEALVFAEKLHRQQVRKGSGVPYVAHLLGVASLVLEAGGDEDEAIAALLHDAIEDQGGWETRTLICEKFGERVATIVEGCSDSFDGEKKRPWRERKEAYLQHLRTASASVHLVAMADKLYNAQSILRDYQRIGEALWPRFKGKKEGTLWYYNSLLKIFDLSHPLAQELHCTMETLKTLVAANQAHQQ